MERYRAIFGANSTSREDFISAFVSHNDAIRVFFSEELKQPHRLFEIDLTDKKYDGGIGWAKFCDFVGLSIEQCPSVWNLESEISDYHFGVENILLL